MGIRRLLPELSPAMKPGHVKDFYGKVAAVDVSMWVYKALSTPFATPLQLIMSNVKLIRSNGVEPLLVFDSYRTIEAKSVLLEQRAREPQRF